MATIEGTKFDINAPNKIKEMKYGSEWPVVYIINNDTEAYVGETVNASSRTSQHLQREDRRRLDNINIISDTNFNKSVILDLESFLIKHMSADGLFKLQNVSMGNQPHHYYQREAYEKQFNNIWDQLHNIKLVKNSIQYIENSDIFKYSPYKNLSQDQYRVACSIIESLYNSQEHNSHITTMVEGGAGTGKTVLAIYLMKILNEVGKNKIEIDYDIDPGYAYLYEILNKMSSMKIGLVVPMQSLRSTIKNVFKNMSDMKSSMVVSPVEVPKNKMYDLLIVDEAHRLRQRKALAQYPAFDKNNALFGLGNEGTELDWILRSSKNQVFFYDSMQSVKPSDIDQSAFDDLKLAPNTQVLSLNSQFRCAGGDKYVTYVKRILSDTPPTEKLEFEGYDLKLFDDVNDMIEAIKEKDKEFGLCRTVAGYAWKWISKKDSSLNDITIGKYSYKWNSTSQDWVNSPNSINEIGCIHTIQGYDLNYTGVIFGNEIQYDPVNDKIIINKDNYHDRQGKTSLKNQDSLKEYILNIYRTLMTRGIRGTYVYVCDRNLKSYISKYINS